MASGAKITDYLSYASGAPSASPSLATATEIAFQEDSATGKLYLWYPLSGTWQQVPIVAAGSYASTSVVGLVELRSASANTPPTVLTDGDLAVASGAASLNSGGHVPLTQLSGLTTSQLSATAGIVAGQVASVNPSVLTGSGTVPLAALTGITASQLSGSAAITGSQLSASAAIAAGQIASVNPSALTGSGTVPLGGLSGITTSQLSGSAGILGSQLSASAAIAAGQVSSVNPSALTGSGTVPVAALPVMVASGSSHAAGVVGDPGSSAGSTRYWCENAAFSIPPGTTPTLASDTGKYTGANVAITSTTYVDLQSTFNLTLTTGAHRCLVIAQLNFFCSSSANGFLDISVDGTLQGGTNGLALLDFNGFTNPVTLCYLTAVLSAGSHTIKPRVKAATSQTVTLDSSGDGLANYFQVVETLIAT